MEMLDEEFLTFLPDAGRHFAVGQLDVDEPARREHGMNVSEQLHWILHVFENFVESHHVKRPNVVHFPEIAANRLNSDARAQMVGGPRIGIHRRARPTRLSHRVWEHTQA